MSHILQTLKNSFDQQPTINSITQEFCKRNQTQKPKSIGIQFKDIYLDGIYEPAPAHPNNNCYFGVDYPLNVDHTPENIKTFMNNFLKSYYYGNEEIFLVKLAQMRCGIE